MTPRQIEAAFAAYWNGKHETQRDALKAALEAAESAAWEDIGTAPRDGTPLLVCRGDSMRWAVWSEGFWRDGQKHTGGKICGCPNPTHWRPLPAPPKVV